MSTPDAQSQTIRQTKTTKQILARVITEERILLQNATCNTKKYKTKIQKSP